MASAYDELEELREADYQDAVDAYMHGKCMYLAAALHFKYGLSIEAATYDSARPKQHPRISERVHDIYHCWVVLPNGERFDIRGAQSLEEMTKLVVENCDDFGWESRIRVCSVDELARHAKLPSLSGSDVDVQEALDVYETFDNLVWQLESKLGDAKHGDSNHDHPSPEEKVASDAQRDPGKRPRR
jgi:hypothetical protein